MSHHRHEIRTIIVFVIMLTTSSLNAQQDSGPPAQQAMLAMVNDIRAAGCQCGDRYMPPAPPLSWDVQLESAALRHALDLNLHQRLSHTGSDGSSISDRVAGSGYEWRAVGENISWNYDTMQASIEGWKRSPGHCVNMMSRSFREMGAAQDGPYMVQVFGRKWAEAR